MAENLHASRVIVQCYGMVQFFRNFLDVQHLYKNLCKSKTTEMFAGNLSIRSATYVSNMSKKTTEIEKD